MNIYTLKLKTRSRNYIFQKLDFDDPPNDFSPLQFIIENKNTSKIRLPKNQIMKTFILRK